jgi:hypothetical protein
MPGKDGFDPDLRLPRFLADKPERQVIGNVWDTAVIGSQVLKASICAGAAIAIGAAIISIGNPVTLVADVTASLVEKSALELDTDKSTPRMQSSSDAPASPPSAKDAPTGDESAPASKLAGQSRSENSESASETLSGC